MRQCIEQAMEDLDASIFTGDLLQDEESRAELKAYLARWQRAIGANDGTADQVDFLERTIKSLIIERDGLNQQISRMINRRGDIETTLLNMAAGKLALPNEQDCRVLALRLGTPKEEWSDIIKAHRFIALDKVFVQ